jgi:hypothetical protein
MKVLRMNKASMLVEINGSTFLVTRNVFNKIVSNQVSEVIVVEKTYNDVTSRWLALVSIF